MAAPLATNHTLHLTDPAGQRPIAAMSPKRRARRAGLVAALAALPVALAYRFAPIYRVRAG